MGGRGGGGGVPQPLEPSPGYAPETAILQEINEEKRPEKIRDCFSVSNSTLFEMNVIFI